jgi:aquaporin Z
MRNYVTEFIGTFFLVLTIGLSIQHAPGMAPLAIGASLMIMVYMGGHVSGGHYNPAVSMAAVLRGALPSSQYVPYVLSQLAGAFVASLATWALGCELKAFAPADINIGRALLNEFLFTFALALVVLNTATAPKVDGNSFYGLAIGFTVVVAAFAGGAISGGAYNPAVGIGKCLVEAMRGGSSMKHVWIYIVAPLAGGALAAPVFLMQNRILAPKPAGVQAPTAA